ncbi:MAG: hypothetical protein QG622_3661 [Actinomycetota bacterium]|nr:hypothetical protein [Actinomycetota bacterium]
MTALTPSGVLPTGLDPGTSALIAEACAKSNVIWVRTVESDRHHLAWHAWLDGAVYLVSGAGEQTLPRLCGQVEVIVPSKDNGSRLVTFIAQADELLPARSPEWEEAAAALSAVRLNTADPANQIGRWASGNLLARLTPVHLVHAGPGDDTTPSGAAVPPGSPATTVGAHQPWHAGGRARSWREIRRSKQLRP